MEINGTTHRWIWKDPVSTCYCTVIAFQRGLYKALNLDGLNLSNLGNSSNDTIRACCQPFIIWTVCPNFRPVDGGLQRFTWEWMISKLRTPSVTACNTPIGWITIDVGWTHRDGGTDGLSISPNSLAASHSQAALGQFWRLSLQWNNFYSTCSLFAVSGAVSFTAQNTWFRWDGTPVFLRETCERPVGEHRRLWISCVGLSRAHMSVWGNQWRRQMPVSKSVEMVNELSWHNRWSCN